MGTFDSVRYDVLAMKYLSREPIKFAPPKGGWPVDWEKQPISGDCVDATSPSLDELIERDWKVGE